MSEPAYNSNDSSGSPYYSNDVTDPFQFGVDYLPYQLDFGDPRAPNSQYIVPGQSFHGTGDPNPDHTYADGTAPNSIYPPLSLPDQYFFSEALPIDDWLGWSDNVPLQQGMYAYGEPPQDSFQDTVLAAEVSHGYPGSQPVTFSTSEAQMNQTASSPRTSTYVLSQNLNLPDPDREYRWIVPDGPLPPQSCGPSTSTSKQPTAKKPRQALTREQKNDANVAAKAIRSRRGAKPRAKPRYTEDRESQRIEIMARPRDEDGKVTKASRNDLQKIYRKQRDDDKRSAIAQGLAASDAELAESASENEGS